MPDSPMVNSSAVVKLSILAAGSPIDDAIGIISVSVTRTINKIPYARIELLDGDMPEQDFPVSNTDAFKPGGEIEIKAGYGDSEETIFKGIIVKHGIKITGDNQSRLVIECRDKAVKMTIGRKNANFIDKKDSDIIKKIVGDYGLSPDIAATTTSYKELVQYYCSDWDFVLSRAEVNGMLICVEDAKLSVKKPEVSGSPELKLTYGYDLIELHAEIDARSQLTAVESVSWDPKNLAVVKQSSKPQTMNAQGDLKSNDLAKIVGPDSFGLQTSGLIEAGALKSWADAQLVKAGLARIRGRMKFQGSAKATPGSLIELDGVGAHFNGNVFVSSVSHQITAGNWISEVSFGMSPDWFAEQRDLVAPPASGWLPGVEGLQIGVVMKLDEDPDEQSRVQVKVPVLQAQQEGVWARLANFHASNGIGAFFVPEIGDEVILGYLNNDPSNPVVLGSLYGPKNKPPYELSAENNTKAIVTRSELKIEFDEDKKITTIVTPGNNTIVLSDDEKSILLQDQNDNKVELSPDGIVLDSPKDISITAQGKITIEAMDAIDVSAQADVSVKGLNVNHEANVGFVAKGNASAELSASGQTTVKGAMVMIN
jgi:Rhs element Vgr protein